MGAMKEKAIKAAEEQSIESAAELVKGELGLNERNAFEKLHEIDVKPNLIQKQGLDYLPWACVYDYFNSVFGPDEWDVTEIDDERTGFNYFSDGKSAWVKVSIRIGSTTKTCSLPVMDNHNRSIMDGKWTSFDVNDALQRCKVKCAAYWGLGTEVFTKLQRIEMTTKAESEEKAVSGRVMQAVNALTTAASKNEVDQIKMYFTDVMAHPDVIAAGKAAKERIGY